MPIKLLFHFIERFSKPTVSKLVRNITCWDFHWFFVFPFQYMRRTSKEAMMFRLYWGNYIYMLILLCFYFFTSVIGVWMEKHFNYFKLCYDNSNVFWPLFSIFRIWDEWVRRLGCLGFIRATISTCLFYYVMIFYKCHRGTNGKTF